LDFIVISLLCAAVILFAYDKWWMGGPPEQSIAVLAFENMSDDPEQEYFSDGISEELLSLLSKIPQLTVISRSSAFSFKGKDITIPEVAEQLNVALVLDGSVRRDGDRLRITAQLIEASSDSHVWSQSYDRELENIFAIQDEISAAIVTALKEHLGLQVEATPRVITAANTEAHEAYLRGRYLVVQRTRATIEGAVREFEKAIALDPEYALAHAELAIATLLLKQSQFGGLTVTEAIAKAAPHAELAMALDPTLAEAHAATGLVLWNQDNLEETQTHFRQAIRINPNYALVHNWMANLLDDDLGHYIESFAMREMGLRLDPLSRPAISNYIDALTDRNRLDEADRELEKLAAIAPAIHAIVRGYRMSLGGKWANMFFGWLDACRINPELSKRKVALAWRSALIDLEKEALAIIEVAGPMAGLSYVLRILGRPGDAVTAAEAHFAKDPISLSARRDLGLALASAGDYARAQPILEEMWQRSDGRITKSPGLFQIDAAAALIAIRRAAGEETEVGELLAAIRDNVRRYREAGITRVNTGRNNSVDYEEGLADYLAGEREGGLALIAKAVEDGFIVLPGEAYLKVLYDDPGFAPIRASQEARQARERKRFLAIVCTDNPYAAVWQTAEGTCERFAAVSAN
jgi:TolB-like protein